MLIDCHVHVNNYDETTATTTEEVVASLFAEMESCGVAHAVVLTSYKVTPHRPHAGKVIEVIDDDPRITIVEGLRWRPDRKDERTDLFALEERVQRGAVKGIKLYPGYDKYPINDPSLESFFRLAEKYQIPVMIHTGDTLSKRAKVRQAHPLLVDDLAVDYPDVNFVMCHLGNPWFDDAAEVLYKNDNVFADISGLTLSRFSAEFERHMLERVREMIRYMGDPGRQLLYGSDWPLVGMKGYRKFFEGLDISDDQREAVAWQNAARLFRIDVSRLSGAPAA